MTNKEAIKLLRKVAMKIPAGDIVDNYEDFYAAFSIAISALEEIDALPENLHREKEQAYMQGYEDGRKSEWRAE